MLSLGNPGINLQCGWAVFLTSLLALCSSCNSLLPCSLKEIFSSFFPHFFLLLITWQPKRRRVWIKFQGLHGGSTKYKNSSSPIPISFDGHWNIYWSRHFVKCKRTLSKKINLIRIRTRVWIYTIFIGSGFHNMNIFVSYKQLLQWPKNTEK